MFIFLVQVVIISLTGVMAPGPISAATVGTGTRSPHAGALVAVGHGIIEFPLMVLVYFGLGDILREPGVRSVIFLLGGMFLLFMGADMLRNIKKAVVSGPSNSSAPLAAGILLSMGNAYFLLWWATVGASLITKAVAFGLAGVLAFAVVHWLCDFIWLYTLSVVSYRGGHLFGVRFQQVVSLICGIALTIFGVLFLADAVRGLAG